MGLIVCLCVHIKQSLQYSWALSVNGLEKYLSGKKNPSEPGQDIAKK